MTSSTTESRASAKKPLTDLEKFQARQMYGSRIKIDRLSPAQIEAVRERIRNS